MFWADWVNWLCTAVAFLMVTAFCIIDDKRDKRWREQIQADEREAASSASIPSDITMNTMNNAGSAPE
jgi:hypothetical protein